MLDGELRISTIPKPGGGRRAITTLGPRAAGRYDRAVAATLPWVERNLHRGVLANRAWVGRDGLVLDDWVGARRRHRASIAAFASGDARAAFVGDVRDCFSSIHPASVARALRRLGVPPDGVAGVVGLLEAFERRGVQGLPVGPVPSAVLANAVLIPVDVAVAGAAGIAGLRWVDDLVAVSRDRATARRAGAAFERALLEIGLEPAVEKCRLVEIDELATIAGRASTGTPDRHGMMRAP